MKPKTINVKTAIIFFIVAIISALVRDIYFLILSCTMILASFIDRAGYEKCDRR